MKLTRNMKAISKLLLILLLLAATVIGAILSYLWVIGYYVSLDRVYPEDVTVNITDYAFDHQNTSYFHVTIQCPTSYKSKETANVTRITVSTEDGFLHDEINTDPLLPYKFPHKGESQTFKCFWNWANYTGETIEIIAFVADGSGLTFEAKTPLVDLRVIDVRFNSTISVTHFNMTIRNYDVSVTYVNVTEITVDEEDVTPSILTLPYTLHPGDSVPFMCSWNWTDHQGKNVTIAVKTLQGYVAYYPEPPERTTLLSPVVLTITEVLFEVTNTTRFNVTVQYSEGSAHYVNITRITVAVENRTAENITTSVPSLPRTLYRNESLTFTCIWNWTDYRGNNTKVTVHTLQDFKASFTRATEARVILEITDVLFKVTDTSYFNVTVRNSEFSLEEFVNITRITVTVEDGSPIDITQVTPPLNYTLYRNDSRTFKCLWTWADHREKKVTVVVYTLQGYSANKTKPLPSRVILNITKVLFDLADTTRFNATVQNSELSLDYVFIMSITVTLEDGTVYEMNGIKVVPILPYVLHKNESVVFLCSWDWTEYCDQNVTIAVNTLQGYVAYHTERTPLSIIIGVTDVLFDIADTTYFNVSVRNSDFSLEDANITRITLTMENGTTLEITEVVPSLPRMLSPNSSLIFECSWSWTDYRGKNATFAVYTLQDYTAYYTQATPEPVILTITRVLFDVIDPSYFNITVHNSEFSLEDYVNITRVTVTVENGTPENITVEPPITLYANKTVTFKCLWNWTNYQGQNVTITVHTLQGYVADCSQSTPMLLTITDVLFNLLDTDHFVVTVQNPTWLNFTITTINVTVEDMAPLNITDVVPSLPFMLSNGTDILFMCSWNWTDYQGRNVTITIETLEGYTTSYTCTIPSEYIITVLTLFPLDNLDKSSNSFR